jgi:hypothetical protein
MPCSILSVFPTLDSEPKRYQNSGLRKDLKKNSKAEETFDPFQSGGLNDEDASSTRPTFPQARTQRSHPHVRSEPEAKDLKRDQSRKNNVGYRFIFSLYFSFSHHIFHFTATLNQFVQFEFQESGDERDAGPTKRKVKVHVFIFIFNAVF